VLVCLAAASFADSMGEMHRNEILSEIQINEKGEIIYGSKTEVPADALFQDAEAFCEGCYGLVMEVSQLLRKWSDEEGTMKDHVDAASYAACRRDKLRSYVLSPPKMVKLCTGILVFYYEPFTTALLLAYTQYEWPSQQHLLTAVCQKAVPACEPGALPMSISR
ncbi:hypothetical protein FHG87_016324, partial [Trinorchestia longiramus]